MITLEKVKVQLYHKEFLAALDTTIRKGLVSAGKDFETKVKSRTPVAPAAYPRAGKLRENIRATNYVTTNGNEMSVSIASQAMSYRRDGRRRHFYGRFLEHGSPTTPAYGMFSKTKERDLPGIIDKNIVQPLRKMKIK